MPLKFYVKMDDNLTSFKATCGNFSSIIQGVSLEILLFLKAVCRTKMVNI